tara:strand:- start:14607 stop:15014 length:408 start_codon:yes stop_codon:yes gene_type:complete
MISIKKITTTQTYHLRHTVMWPNHPIDFIKLPEDEEGVHFGLFENDELVCIVSLFIKNKTAQFRKLATKVSDQGKGYATQILHHIILYCSQLKIEKLWCNARANKTSFYKKFGLDETKKTYSKGGIDFIVLEKNF